MKKAIIIGGGPAGLTAAYKLLKETHIIPIILEESDVIGGISQTVKYNGNRMDIGGHRFFSKSKEVMNLWQEILPIQGCPSKDDLILNKKKQYIVNGPDPEKTDDVMLIRERVSRIFYLRKFFDYPVSFKYTTFKNMGLFRTIKAGFGYIWSAIFKRKEKNLEDFMINRFGKPLYQMFFEDYTQKVWGRHPKEISADWGEQRIKGLSLSKALKNAFKKIFGRKKKDLMQSGTETSLIEQFIYPKFGPGQLYEKMAEIIVSKGGEIRLNSKVTAINIENGIIKNLSINDIVIEGDYFISTMPVKDLINCIKGAIVPPVIAEIAANLPYRDFITVGLLLKKLKFKNKTKNKTVNDIIPDCWIYLQDRDVKIGRLQVFNNWSPYLVKEYESKIWIGLEYFCNENDNLWNMSDEDFINFSIDELIKINLIDKDDVLDAVRVKIKKAYPAYFGSYSQFGEIINYLNTIDNLYCVGRNGQHKYNNMDHSILTAMEAVKCIKNNINDKTNIWNVNAEKEYHEIKNT